LYLGIPDSPGSLLRIKDLVSSISGGNSSSPHYKYVQTIIYSLVDMIIIKT
jgi:hypothetical protein